jgi:hypothetical protein
MFVCVKICAVIHSTADPVVAAIKPNSVGSVIDTRLY